MTRCLLMMAVAACLLTGDRLAAQEWGSLKGQFVFDGTPPERAMIDPTADRQVCGQCMLKAEELVVDAESKGIANVVIYLRSRRVDANPEVVKALPEFVELDNNCCAFKPRVVALTLDQSLRVLNSDPVGHNAACAPLGDTPFNPIIAPKAKYDHKFQRAQRVPQPVSCSIHPWMKAWVLPLETPYFAVTDKDGKFSIEGLPAGTELEFQVWQEKAGYLEAKSDWRRGQFSVTVPAGDTLDLGTIAVPAATFDK